MRVEAPIETVSARAYKIPTDLPEADGTATWDSTTIIIVKASAAGRSGLGYTYTNASATLLINDVLRDKVKGLDVFNPPAAWLAMQRAVRNFGREGLAATAISAVDIALWDLKATVAGQSLSSLLGQYRDAIPIYGSGGFTTYNDRQLTEQLSRWVQEDKCRWVKMKVGSDPSADPKRVETARRAIGSAGLFVDANGAYSLKQAERLACVFAEGQDVSWFEEPVSSDDLSGLRRMRRAAPAPMEIAAGEYGYTSDYFRRMLEADAVDVLQADATRCGGVTGFLQAAALCEPFHRDLSAHCAPALHRHLGCAAPRFRHLEWFHDHVRVEHMLFDGAPKPLNGLISPDESRPGLGLEFKQSDAEQFAVGAEPAR